jgi:hypothetical protein
MEDLPDRIPLRQDKKGDAVTKLLDQTREIDVFQLIIEESFILVQGGRSYAEEVPVICYTA